MAKLQQVLSDEIRKQIRKEMNGVIRSLKAQIAEQRNTLREYNLRIKNIEKNQFPKSDSSLQKTVSTPSESPEKNKTVRVTPARIKKWRTKFGLSQMQFAILLDVNVLSVNHWESGKTVPREEQKRKITWLRDLGKRELKKLMQDKNISLKKHLALKNI